MVYGEKVTFCFVTWGRVPSTLKYFFCVAATFIWTLGVLAMLDVASVVDPKYYCSCRNKNIYFSLRSLNLGMLLSKIIFHKHVTS